MNEPNESNYIIQSTQSLQNFLNFSKNKILEILNCTQFNNVEVIKSNKNIFLFHMRHLDESKETFDRPKWFVFNPSDLFVIFMFRIWQENYSLNLNNFKKKLIVDVYEVQNNLNLLKFNCRDYPSLEDFVNCVDLKYEKSSNKKDFDNIDIANWLEKNNKTITLDGWYEKSNRLAKIKDKVKIDEVMILPTSSNNLKLVCSESVEDILDFDEIYKTLNNQERNLFEHLDMNK